MAEVTINTETKADPNAALGSASNITGDGNHVVVDPSKKADGKGGDQRPAWLPEKFTSAEEMAKAYVELEKKQGQQSQSTVTQTQLDKAGVDSRALAKEVADSGSLSDTSKAALVKAGVDPDVFVAGLRAQETQAVAELSKVAGGEKEFDLVREWAAANLSAAEAQAYNSALDAGNLESAKLIMSGIVAKYTAAMGRDPATVVTGDASVHSGVQPFESTAQMVAAMSDPKYKTDPAFRAEVIKRVGASSTFHLNAATGAMSVS